MEANKSIYYFDKTKYIVTEHYNDKIELKDAIINILHSQYTAERNKRKSEEAKVNS